MKFPPSPRVSSSSAGVLCKDRDKGKPDRDGYCNDARNPPRRKRCRIETKWSQDGLATTACYMANGKCLQPAQQS